MMAAWESIGILGLVMVLLISNRVRIDLVGLMALGLVGLFRLVPAKDLFLGFSSYAAIIVAEMFVLGEGLRQSGVTDAMSRWLERVGEQGEAKLTTALLALPPIPSTFISDVGLMGIFLPTMMRIRQHVKISLHRLLMPLAVSIALGGLLSMIGSAGNIIGNATLASSRLAPLGLFSITPVGIVLVLAGFLFMKTWGLKHLPSADGSAEFLTDYNEVKAYLTEIGVQSDSPLIGKSLREIGYFRQHQIRVVRIFRNGEAVLSPGPGDVLNAGDRLLVQGDRESIVDLTEDQGLEWVTSESRVRLRNDKTQVVEALVPHRSILDHHTLTDTNFRTRYGLTVLAVLRQGVTTMVGLPEMKLRSGDVLLVMGSNEAISRAQLSDDLLVFANVEAHPVRSRGRMIWTAAVMAAILLVAAFNFLSLTVAAVLGIVTMILSRVLTLSQAYRSIEWRIITLIGGITPLSMALTRNGVTAAMAHSLVYGIGGDGSYVMLAAFFWLAALLTQVISNVAAALVLSPLAITIAENKHWSPYPLIVMMVVALSAAPITPLANKVFIMAMGPGDYQYKDFFKIGIPLTFLMFAIAMILVPVAFPFAQMPHRIPG